MNTSAQPASPRILTLDLGGSHLKGAILDPEGREIAPYQGRVTPKPASPERVLEAIDELVASLGGTFDYVSMGFPGYVRNGTVVTAPNLGTEEWAGVPLKQLLVNRFLKPVQVVNDADLLGLGIAEGKGVELVVTFGTGVGTAFLLDGVLLPHLELAHHPILEGIDYDQYIGHLELKRVGPQVWNERVREVIKILDTVFHYDTLYLAGGNARLIDFDPGPRARISDNKTGIQGGVRLWRTELAGLLR